LLRKQRKTLGATFLPHPVHINLFEWTNKKFELMLMRHAKAYSSSGSVV